MPDQTPRSAITLDVPDGIELIYHNRKHTEKLTHERFHNISVSPEFAVVSALGDPFASTTQTHAAEALYEYGHGHAKALVHLNHHHGQLTTRVAARSLAVVESTLAWVAGRIPEYVSEDQDIIPVTFWASTPRGPTSWRREMDADSWATLTDNYPTKTRMELARMMVGEFKPGLGGQLVLWNGDPGTGKTTALRALAREWRDWCSMHYIVDPDEFFGDNAAYLLQVLMQEDDGPEIYDEPKPDSPKWRVMVLEDCGELLQPDARREVGQGLSRLLNACDGLIGRGLRIMVLITTNEPVERLHPAVRRPGRCAARIEFDRFKHDEALAWMETHDGAVGKEVPASPTLADLYGLTEGFEMQEDQYPLGFRA